MDYKKLDVSGFFVFFAFLGFGLAVVGPDFFFGFFLEILKIGGFWKFGFLEVGVEDGFEVGVEVIFFFIMHVVLKLYFFLSCMWYRSYNVDGVEK